MTTITRSSLVMYTPDQMFDLVNDVEAYPRFLPWCRDSRIISKNEDVICASLDIAKGGIHHELAITRGVVSSLIWTSNFLPAY